MGIMTRFPIVYTNYTNLKFVPGSADSNTRIALRALVDTPNGQFDFFVTHFSYAKGAGQMQNALGIPFLALHLLHFLLLTVLSKKRFAQLYEYLKPTLSDSSSGRRFQHLHRQPGTHGVSHRKDILRRQKRKPSRCLGNCPRYPSHPSAPYPLTHNTTTGNDDGFTFSNLPTSTGLINRADRVLTRGIITPVTVDRLGQYQPSQQTPASDHLAVLTRVQ